MSNIEQGFITELLVSKNLELAVDNQITSKFFSGNYKQAFRYILNHYMSYGTVPTIKTVRSRFKIDLMRTKGKIKTGEPLQFWCDEIRSKYKHNTLVDALEKTYQKVDELDTDGAYNILKDTINFIENDVVTTGSLSINKGTKERFESYKERQSSGGMTGLPTGIELWDKITGGLNKGELTCLMAFTGVGKTWFLIIVAVFLSKMGYKVLFCTTEMSKEMVMRRVDAVWCKLNYTRFKSGQLTKDEEKKYLKYLKDVEGSESFLRIEQISDGVSQVGAKVSSIQPDITLVDGAYLLSKEDEDNWLATVKVFRALHQMSINFNIPFVATTQSKDEIGATLKSIQFTRALAQDCDVVAVLEQDDQMKVDREVKLKPLKLREGDLLTSVFMNWDFNTMEYGSLYTVDKEEELLEEEEEQQGVMKID